MKIQSIKESSLPRNSNVNLVKNSLGQKVTENNKVYDEQPRDREEIEYAVRQRTLASGLSERPGEQGPGVS